MGLRGLHRDFCPGLFCLPHVATAHASRETNGCAPAWTPPWTRAPVQTRAGAKAAPSHSESQNAASFNRRAGATLPGRPFHRL